MAHEVWNSLLCNFFEHFRVSHFQNLLQTQCEVQKKNTLNVSHSSRGVLRTTEQSRGDEDDDEDDRYMNV